MILIKNANIYSPEPLGIKDILIQNNEIIAIGDDLSIQTNAFDVEIIDIKGQIVIPGYIDQHVHALGGGGENGPHSRTPEFLLSDAIAGGVTTLIGVLGTDGTTRHPESLLAKIRGLNHEGITAYMLTGSYELPLVTITGDARKDIIFINEILGIGEFAISDHRSSQPTLDEVKKLASQARLGGMLAGKAGPIQFHLGDGKAKLSMLFKIIEETEIPAKHLIPTHVNRSHELFEEALEVAKLGAFIDITSSISIEGKNNNELFTPAKAMRACYEHKNAEKIFSQLTMSSDGNGSMPVFNDKGETIDLTAAKVTTLHEEIRTAVLQENLPIEKAIAVCTKNPAIANGLYPKKGSIQKGSDADLLFLDKDFNIESVIAKGRFLMKNKQHLAKGTFE